MRDGPFTCCTYLRRYFWHWLQLVYFSKKDDETANILTSSLNFPVYDWMAQNHLFWNFLKVDKKNQNVRTYWKIQLFKKLTKNQIKILRHKAPPEKYSVFMVPEQEFRNIRFENQCFSKILNLPYCMWMIMEKWYEFSRKWSRKWLLDVEMYKKNCLGNFRIRTK